MEIALSTESLILTDRPVLSGVPRPLPAAAPRAFSVELARSRAEIEATQRLRYAIFAGEMGAKLHNRIPGLDHDRFDAYCQHLLVRGGLGRIIGCTRLLTPEGARRVGGFYSQTEFDLAPVLALPGRFLEIGRTCIHPDYRNGATIGTLWSGLAAFVADSGRLPDRLRQHAVGRGWRRSASAVRRTGATPSGSRSAAGETAPAPAASRWRRAQRVRRTAAAESLSAAGRADGGEPCLDPDFHVADVFILLASRRIERRYARHFWIGINEPAPAPRLARAARRGVRLPLLVLYSGRSADRRRPGAGPAAGYVSTRPLAWWSRGLCRIMGVKVRASGTACEGAALFVANHLSWLDIFCIAAFCSTQFLAKQEVAGWPLFGWLCRRAGTAFIRRGGDNGAGKARSNWSGGCGGASGCWCSRKAHPPPAQRSGASIPGCSRPRFWPIARCRPSPCAIPIPRIHPLVPFVDDDELLPHLWRLLGEPGLVAELRFGAVHLPPHPSATCWPGKPGPKSVRWQRMPAANAPYGPSLPPKSVRESSCRDASNRRSRETPAPQRFAPHALGGRTLCAAYS